MSLIDRHLEYVADARRFVDAVFALYPAEAVSMAAQAAAGRMAFGASAVKYGDADTDAG